MIEILGAGVADLHGVYCRLATKYKDEANGFTDLITPLTREIPSAFGDSRE